MNGTWCKAQFIPEKLMVKMGNNGHQQPSPSPNGPSSAPPSTRRSSTGSLTPSVPGTDANHMARECHALSNSVAPEEPKRPRLDDRDRPGSSKSSRGRGRRNRSPRRDEDNEQGNRSPNTFQEEERVVNFIFGGSSVPSVDAYQRHHWRSAMASADVNGVVGKSWATNKSASARSTAVAFYPRVIRGVIYISARKAVVYII